MNFLLKLNIFVIQRTLLTLSYKNNFFTFGLMALFLR